MARDIHPIRNDDDHRKALAEIEQLWDAEADTPEHDRLEVLATLVSAYEDRRWPIEASDPVEAVKFHMEQTGCTQADLAILLGSRSRASEIPGPLGAGDQASLRKAIAETLG